MPPAAAPRESSVTKLPSALEDLGATGERLPRTTGAPGAQIARKSAEVSSLTIGEGFGQRGPRGRVQPRAATTAALSAAWTSTLSWRLEATRTTLVPGSSKA